MISNNEKGESHNHRTIPLKVATLQNMHIQFLEVIHKLDAMCLNSCDQIESRNSREEYSRQVQVAK